MDKYTLMTLSVFGVAIALIVGIIAFKIIRTKQYEKLSLDVLRALNLDNWKYLKNDAVINLKSSKAVDEYNEIKFFKDNREKLFEAEKRLNNKREYASLLESFINENEFKSRPMYSKLEKFIKYSINDLYTYNVEVTYRSPAGRSTNYKMLRIDDNAVKKVIDDPSLVMGKGEYNKYIKEKNQELLNQKHHEFYDRVNEIIDVANANKDSLVIKGDLKELDRLISSLFEKTVNSIKKIKSIDSEEWEVIDKVIQNTDSEVKQILNRNKKILEYYDSAEFKKIKTTCISLMDSQKEFNEYINEKAKSISTLFGSRVVRNETEVNDEYKYIRPYKKSITPYTAEVSSTVFASAENNPLDYIVKYFYPNKELYPEQIQKLQLLVEELETLKEAKQIIENYKKDYQQYLTDVPSYVLENDEDGFYSRLGFADVSESVLTVEYKFSYTSDGGMAQRAFTVPMTEETIVDLVNILQSKLTIAAFAKEQRNMMTSKLRQYIKERDNFTCKICNNSTFKEPNLLLEIDHIIPVSRGGCTVEDNLQTLCWKCNRKKAAK